MLLPGPGEEDQAPRLEVFRSAHPEEIIGPIQVVPYGMEIRPVGQGSYVIWQYQASTRQAGYTPDR
jgi:hypothetical protein